MKNGKAPGLDGIPPEVWKLPKIRKILRSFCNETYHGNRPDEWGISAITSIPKKGNLKLTDNYRGISLTQVAAKVYNLLLLNRIRPTIDEVLSPNQNGFRTDRSTAAHILALRRLVEELKNHQKEAVLLFIDFKKAFDSIDRNVVFKILEAYGIPPEIVEAIRIMYTNTSATVITPEGLTDFFTINTGVLQGDPLAPFLFIICLDFALRKAIEQSDGITLKSRRSRRHPAECLADLGYADDIVLLEDDIQNSEACQSLGLYLNATKTKFMHLNLKSEFVMNSLGGSKIEKVNDFKYLGCYTTTSYDMDLRIGQAWGAMNSLNKVWKSNIKSATKTKVFKASVESILLYGSDSWSVTKTLSKKLDGTYTRKLRKAFNISWSQHITNKMLYGNLPYVSSIVRKRRLTLAGHVFRYRQPSSRLLLWSPEEKRKAGRPSIT